MEPDDDIDIYADLTNFGEKTSDDCSESTLELKKKCTDLEDQVSKLEKELKDIQIIKNTLEINLSSLVKTAKTEIARKDRMIGELRAELEKTIFRRNNYRIPRVQDRFYDSKNNFDINENQQSYFNPTVNNPMIKDEPTEQIDNTEPAYVPPSIKIENDVSNDSGGETYQPNKFTSTVYGERLRRKLMEETNAENRKKELNKSVASTSVKIEIKDEPETNPKDIHRDNKENRYQEVTPSTNIVENPVKKLLKRSNDKELDGCSDKRRKLSNHKHENVYSKENGDSDSFNIPKSSETINKINYRLEPIELSPEISNPKPNEEKSNYKHFDSQRDLHRNNYHRPTNSRSRSKDNSIYSDRVNENSHTKNRENRRRDTDRSNNYRSSSVRNFQNPRETRQNSRSRTDRSTSRYRERTPDLREHIGDHKRQRNDRGTDRRYKNRNRNSHSKHERSIEPGRNHDFHRKHEYREHDKKYRDHREFSAEYFSDKSNDSISMRKSESQLLKAKDYSVVENKNIADANGLEEGEICSPISTPKRLVKNNLTNGVNHSVIQALDHHLLDSLSVETPDLGTTNRNFRNSVLPSSQEEKIENIAAFIRNYTSNEVSNDLPSSIEHEIVDKKINTSTDIAETLKLNTDIKENNQPSKENGEVKNAGECTNCDEEQQDHPPSEKIPLVIEVKENVNNLSSKAKIERAETISVNNVPTSYTQVLSKFNRKKKKSLSDTDLVEEKDSSKVLEKIIIKNTKEPKDKISNESILPACPEVQQVDEVDDAENNAKKNSRVSANDPIDLPTEESDVSSEKPLIIDEIPTDLVNTNEIIVVEQLDTNFETSECAAQLSDVKSQINSPELTLKNINETDHTVEENEKPAEIAPVTKQLNCEDESLIPVISSSVSDPKELNSSPQQTEEINDKINSTEKNELVESETKCLKIPSEICKENCEDSSEDSKNNINNSKKTSPTLKQNERKIVVARRQKRPVQLGNSSSSLTVVVSAYNINNNRVCKSKTKTSVTLSDT